METTTIVVSKEVWKRLQMIKIDKDFKSLDDVVRWLLDEAAKKD